MQHVLGKGRNGAYWVLRGNLKGRDHLEYLDVYRSIIKNEY
jgi:hypothetical protein